MSETKKHPGAVALGRLGGQRNTEAQQRARAQNGRLGGRPRKDGPAAVATRPPATRRRAESEP